MAPRHLTRRAGIQRWRAALWTSALILAAAAMPARSQDPGAPGCASEPSATQDSVVVPGFPAERVYMHRRHPVLCVDASDPSCKPDAYVIAGDHVLAGADCAGWTRIEFKGRKETIGWVATARLPDHGPLAPADLASPTALVLARSPSRHPACLEAARLLNARREHGRPRGRFVLPSALQNTTDLKVFPKGVGSEYHREDNDVSDALVQGHTLKAVTYSVGGTCFDNYLELWDPTFSTPQRRGIQQRQ